MRAACGPFWREKFHLKKLCVLLASAFGLGLSPVASGTVGSLPGVAIVLALTRVPLMWQIVAAVVLAALAIPICHVAEKVYGKKDDGRIVADEYMTFPICLLGINIVAHPSMLLVGFVVNRVMDILKIPPAYQSQRLKGGLGIVMDDVISSLYALGLNWAVYWFFFLRGGGA